MSARYPVIQPYQTGMLDVGDGHQIYWECSGNPDGIPAIALHGGPGTAHSGGARRFFDPSAYRIVLFHQRGCGNSRPLPLAPDADLSTNTTDHLIHDIDLLRTYLGVDRWTILGVSWGTTLGLAYAQAHPTRVRAMVLALVTATSSREVQWMTEDVKRIFPQEWARFAAAVPDNLRHLRLIDAYHQMLFDPDPDVRDKTAIEWGNWDNAQMSLMPSDPGPRFEDPDFRLIYARIVTHYWRNGSFMAENQLQDNAFRLDGIPGVMIHGRYDVSCPLDTSWQLSQVWKSSEVQIIDVGHGDSTIFPSTVTAALDRFRTLPWE